MRKTKSIVMQTVILKNTQRMVNSNSITLGRVVRSPIKLTQG